MTKKIIGSMRLPENFETLVAWLKMAHGLGINWIDTAWIYGRSEVEKRLGPALAQLKKEGIAFKIQTKIWTSKYREVQEVFQQQLKALGLTKVDALLLHRPSWNFQDDINAWKILGELQKEKLVDTIGVSNYEKDMIEILIAETGIKPAINQIELSVSNFRDDRVFYARKKQIEIQAWSAFGNNVKANLTHPKVKALAQKYQVAPGTILASFLTSQNIILIHASFKKDHLKESLTPVSLSEAEILELKSLNIYDNKFSEMFP